MKKLENRLIAGHFKWNKDKKFDMGAYSEVVINPALFAGNKYLNLDQTSTCSW